MPTISAKGATGCDGREADDDDPSSGDEVMAPGAKSSSAMCLEQFAAIQAALQDGFELEEILAVEGVDERRWRVDRATLSLTIAEDPEVYENYQRALEESQDRLRCAVRPLYDDLAAWIGFLIVVESTPIAVLCSKHGLTVGDFGRLERHWRGRFAADADLAKRALSLRSQPTPPPTPTGLNVGERTLVPSPYAAGADGSRD